MSDHACRLLMFGLAGFFAGRLLCVAAWIALDELRIRRNLRAYYASNRDPLA